MDVNGPPNSIQSRRRGPTLQDWEAIRPKFTTLYLQENPRLKLATIRELVEHEDNFHAETYNYNLRIKKWDICRNLKASEKEHIATEDAAYAQSLGPPSRMVHQRLVRRDKIGRHVRSRRKLARMLNENETNSRYLYSHQAHDSPMLVGSPRSAQHLAILALKHPTPQAGLQLDDAEVFLHAVKGWHEWHFRTQSQSRPAFRPTLDQDGPKQDGITYAKSSNWGNWYDCLVSGLDSFEHKYRVDGWTSFNEGCEDFQRCLSVQPVDLVIDLVKMFCFEDWQSCPQFRDCILKNLHSVAAAMLGREHPLAKLLSLLNSKQCVSMLRLRESLGAMIGDVFGRSHWGKSKDFFLSYSGFWVQETQGKGDSESVSRLEQLSKKAVSFFGAQDWVTLQVNHDYSRALRDNGDLTGARSIFLELLGLSADEATIDDIDLLERSRLVGPELTWSALADLRHTQWKLHEYDQCLIYDRKKLDLCMAQDLSRTETLFSLRTLEESLIESENWAELAELRSKYAQLHQMMPDDLRLHEIPEEVLTSEDGSSLGQDQTMDWTMEYHDGDQAMSG